MEEQATFEELWSAIVKDKACLEEFLEEASDECEAIETFRKSILEHGINLISLPVDSPQFDREKARQMAIELIATTASGVQRAADNMKRVVADVAAKVNNIHADAVAAEEAVKTRPDFYLGRHAYPQWAAYYTGQRAGDLQAALAEYKACVAQAQLVAARYELLK